MRRKYASILWAAIPPRRAQYHTLSIDFTEWSLSVVAGRSGKRQESSIFVTHKRLLAISVCMALAGCATAAQRQYQAMASGNRAAAQETQACVMAVYEDPEFAPLRAHIPPSVDRATLEQLSDPSLATDAEVRAILAVHPKLQGCRQQELDLLTQTTPSFAATVAAEYTKADDSLIELINRKESWASIRERSGTLPLKAAAS